MAQSVHRLNSTKTEMKPNNIYVSLENIGQYSVVLVDSRTQKKIKMK